MSNLYNYNIYQQLIFLSAFSIYLSNINFLYYFGILLLLYLLNIKVLLDQFSHQLVFTKSFELL